MGNVVTKEIDSQALEQFTRMRATDVSDSERRDHEQWLQRDSAHRQAYRAIEHEWQSMDSLDDWAQQELKRLHAQAEPGHNKYAGRKRWWTIAGFSAAASAAVTALIIFVVIPLLSFSERYTTQGGEQRKVVLQDGSSVHLNADSSLKVQFNGELREIVLLRGEALFDVAHEPHRPFVVSARHSKVVAVGTSFSVYYKNGDIDITVVEGQVAILPAQASLQTTADNTTDETRSNTIKKLADTGLLLKSDHRATVNAQGRVETLKKVDAAKLTAWNRGMLVLDGMLLRQVAEEISRYVPGKVQVAAGVPDYPVTGVIKIRDQETMLALLAQVVPVRPVKQSTQLTLLYAAVHNQDGGGSE